MCVCRIAVTAAGINLKILKRKLNRGQKMKLGEISRDWYCSASKFATKGTVEKNGYCRYMDAACIDGNCPNRHRKYPTPEQFKEEFGEEWEGAKYWRCFSKKCVHDNPCAFSKRWHNDIGKASGFYFDSYFISVCACTPFGKPSDGWRPE
jgi:hypothetical protein